MLSIIGIITSKLIIENLFFCLLFIRPLYYKKFKKRCFLKFIVSYLKIRMTIDISNKYLS